MIETKEVPQSDVEKHHGYDTKPPRSVNPFNAGLWFRLGLCWIVMSP